MGFLFSKPIKDCYAPIMFQPPQASYTRDLPGLRFLVSQDGGERQSIPLCIVDRASRITVIYSHGNACDLGHVLPAMTDFADQLQVNVWLYDYPGYGLAEGRAPTEETVCAALATVCEYYEQQARPGDRLILFGTSIGSGPTCWQAARMQRDHYAGVLLECPLASALGVCSDSSAQTSLSIDAFPNYVYATKIKRPVMILHGTADEVIPHRQAEKLAAAMGENLYAMWSIEDAGHNDLYERAGRDAYYTRISLFIRYTCQ